MTEVSVKGRASDAWLRLSFGGIRRAVDIVANRYSRGDVRVAFPIRTEGFFSGNAGYRARWIALEAAGAA